MYLPRKTVGEEAHHSYLAARVSSPANLASFIRSEVRVQRSLTNPPQVGDGEGGGSKNMAAPCLPPRGDCP